MTLIETSCDAEAVLEQLLRALAANRQPGWNFPGHFLELSFDTVEAGAACVSLSPGPHCVDSNGRASLAALGVLADIGMAASIRHDVGPAVRMATLCMSLNLTGAPPAGRLECRSVRDAYVAGATRRTGLSHARIEAGGVLVATGSANFVELPGRSIAPMALRPSSERRVRLLRPDELDAGEQAIYDKARAVLAAGSEGFIDRFWGLTPQAGENGAVCEFENGPQVGNRVGHTQGGVSFAHAAATAMRALDGGWRLVGISAWYVRAGTGARLRAKAELLHQGGHAAMVRTQLLGEDGELVMEALSHHTRST